MKLLPSILVIMYLFQQLSPSFASENEEDNIGIHDNWETTEYDNYIGEGLMDGYEEDVQVQDQVEQDRTRRELMGGGGGMGGGGMGGGGMGGGGMGGWGMGGGGMGGWGGMWGMGGGGMWGKGGGGMWGKGGSMWGKGKGGGMWMGKGYRGKGGSMWGKGKGGMWGKGKGGWFEYGKGYRGRYGKGYRGRYGKGYRGKGYGKGYRNYGKGYRRNGKGYRRNGKGKGGWFEYGKGYASPFSSDGFAPPPLRPSYNSRCTAWAARGECDRYSDYMWNNCAEACLNVGYFSADRQFREEERRPRREPDRRKVPRPSREKEQRVVFPFGEEEFEEFGNDLLAHRARKNVKCSRLSRAGC